MLTGSGALTASLRSRHAPPVGSANPTVRRRLSGDVPLDITVGADPRRRHRRAPNGLLGPECAVTRTARARLWGVSNRAAVHTDEHLTTAIYRQRYRACMSNVSGDTTTPNPRTGSSRRDTFAHPADDECAPRNHQRLSESRGDPSAWPRPPERIEGKRAGVLERFRRTELRARAERYLHSAERRQKSGRTWRVSPRAAREHGQTVRQRS